MVAKKKTTTTKTTTKKGATSKPAKPANKSKPAKDAKTIEVTIPTIPKDKVDKLIKWNNDLGWMLQADLVSPGTGLIVPSVHRKKLGKNEKKLSASEALLLILADKDSLVARAIIQKHCPTDK